MNNSQIYHIKTVTETRFEPDKYGNVYWSIEIEGIQGNMLWKTKNKPEAGAIYGHIEKSQSGKANIFKRDQKPDDYVEAPKPTYTQELMNNTTTPAQVPDMSQSSLANILNDIRTLYKHLDVRFEIVENQIAAIVLDSDTEALVKAQSKIDDPLDDINKDIEEGKPIDLSEIPF